MFALASEMRFAEAYQPLETALKFDSTDVNVIATYAYAPNQGRCTGCAHDGATDTIRYRV